MVGKDEPNFLLQDRQLKSLQGETLIQDADLVALNGHGELVIVSNSELFASYFQCSLIAAPASSSSSIRLFDDLSTLAPLQTLEVPGRVCEIAAGQSHFVLRTDDPPDILTHSKDDRFGQLGRMKGPKGLDSVPFFEGLNVQQVAAGDLHAFAVADGALYAWGSDTKGQCGGFGGTEPTLVEFEVGEEEQPDVKAVACGSMHTLVLMEDGA